MATLPVSLQERLSDLHRRIRRTQALRGGSLVLLACCLALGSALLLDYWLGLGSIARGVLLLAFLGAVGYVALTRLVFPLLQPIPSATLAALVEERHPELAERLTTAVELVDRADPAQGSPALLALLLQETSARTAALDIPQVYPTRSTRWLSWGSGALAAALLLPALIQPSRFLELTQRLLFPWQQSAAFVPWGLDVQPGEVVAARGRPLTLRVQVLPLTSLATQPPLCALVRQRGQGPVERTYMLAERPDLYAFKLDRVESDFTYHIEAGGAVSPRYQVRAADPVELVAESPAIVVTPPAYARGQREAETFYGVVDLGALQHSRMEFNFRFTRPAVSAQLEWTTQGTAKETTVHPLPLSADRLEARLELPAVADAVYRVVLEGEHGLKTELAERQVEVKLDQPPAFLKPVKAAEAPRPVQPYDNVPLDVALNDDVAVAAAEIEYQINDQPTRQEHLVLMGKDSPDASVRHVFKLADKGVKDGDQLRYRLKALDNRNVPEAKLEPNVVYFPAEDRWLTLQISRSADPLRQQEILAQRDAVQRKLDDLKKDLQKEQRSIYRLNQESRNQQNLQAEQREELKDLERNHQDATAALRDLAREAADQAGMQPLADKAANAADQEMRQADQALQAAERAKQADPRAARLQDAEQKVGEAVRRLEEMQQSNQELAQAQLDQMKLEMLAQRQQELGDKAKAEAAKDKPENQPLQREQNDLARDLKQMAEKSDLLREAMNRGNAEQAHEMAEKLRQMAQAERDLADARAAARQEKSGPLADLARKQQELAEQIGKFAEASKTATQMARTEALKPTPAQQAAESLEQGDAGKAMEQQNQNVGELERVAQELERAAEKARDPREVARQLQAAQEAVHQQLKVETQRKDPTGKPAPRFYPVQQDEQKIAQAIKALKAPENNPEAQKSLLQAEDSADKAVWAMQRNDMNAASDRMKDVARALEQMAQKTPSLLERQNRARDEVARLRRQQEEIQKAAEQAQQAAKRPGGAAEAERQMTEAGRRQADSAERLNKLDLPEPRAEREQARKAVDQALRDLLNGKPANLTKSQASAQQALEQLEKAIASKPAANERLARYPEEKPAAAPDPETLRRMTLDLARQQRQLAQATPNARGDDAKAKEARERLVQEQRKLQDRAGQLPTDQGQRTLADARIGMNKAEAALEKGDLLRAQQKQNEAVEALEKLARQFGETPPQPKRSTPEPKAEPIVKPEQATQARQLAQQQRDLRKQVEDVARGAAEKPEVSPARELAEKQEELTKEAQSLEEQIRREQGERSETRRQAQGASHNAKKTGEQLQAGSLPRAQELAKGTGQLLRQLAQKLSQTPRNQFNPVDADPLQKARDLAQKQEELAKQMEPIAKNPEAGRQQQQERQEQLARLTSELMKDLEQMTPKMQKSQEAKNDSQAAAKCCENARSQMGQAQDQGKRANDGQAEKAQRQAGDMLDQAAQHLEKAAKNLAAGARPDAQPGAGNNGKPGPSNAQALQQAQQSMQQASNQLGQQQTEQASNAMQQAANALQQVAQSLGQQVPANQPGQQPGQQPGSQPGETGPMEGGTPTAQNLPPELQKFAGKRWGELPGELRTRIIQDVKARYGDDYARIIKLYFEQIADRSAGNKAVK